MMDIENLIQDFESALLKINRIQATEIFERCLQNSEEFSLIEKLTIRTLQIIGEKWENGSVSLSQVYMSSVICEELIQKFLPMMDVEPKQAPKMAIAVLHDHHALGKRIVHSVLRAGGYEVLDFGQGLNVDQLVQMTIENGIKILMISTLMLPSALKVSEVREKLTTKGAPTIIIVGGAPFRLDKELWKMVHADADGKDATNIVRVIQNFTEGC